MRKIFTVFGILGGVFFLFLLGIYFYFESEIQKPYKIIGEEKIFEVKKGERTRDIAWRLKKEGLLKNASSFIFYVFKTGKGRNISVGKYCLSPEMNVEELVKILSQNPIPEIIKLTFPEGWTISKMEERLKSVGLIEKGDIQKLKIKDLKNDYPFLAEMPQEASLEGFLFPDTYFFRCPKPEISCKNGKAKIIKCQKGKIKEILGRFLVNFDEKLTPEMRKDIKAQGKSIYQILIMASILEKEVQTFEDRKIVSGILWKRLKKDMNLDADATLVYILEKKENWTFEEARKAVREAKKIDSPYNTYKHKGLPPTPISNPGLDSIKAAIYPKETEYFYYLTDPKTKKTIFSKTLKEQQENEMLYFGSDF